ncbi:MAG TPA: V-type ATP synthase subunit D [Bacteroidetes bacterium]|nr:V-type ATP synthase subunit D [Bacteroidota bacterium]
MAIKFQYNKTSLQQLNKQLQIRQRALPTLKNKESALRAEVKKAKDEAGRLNKKYEEALGKYREGMHLWTEFPDELVKVSNVTMTYRKIAGVSTPELDQVEFEVSSFLVFNQPKWFSEGISILKELASLLIEREVFLEKMELLDYARRKTTQKVNLYEKVQIPGYEEAIRKIKRFLEDEENLSKSAQKIVKSRQQKQKEAV